MTTNSAYKHLQSTILRGGRLTKWKGITCSIAPAVGAVILPGLMGSFSPLALTVGGMMAGASPSSAGTCAETAPGSEIFSCSGPAGADTIQVLETVPDTRPSIVASTNPGFGITITGTFGRGALELLARASSTSLTFLDENNSTITGPRHGIFAYNASRDGLTIDVSGDVTGGTDGIHGFNYLSNAPMSITASGTVTGTNNDGIHIYSWMASGDRMIVANDVNGGNNGIHATAFDGALSITANGTVTGTNNNGIFAFKRESGDLTIEATGDVRGGDNGIVARHIGDGALSITVSGTAEGTSAYGIFVGHRGSGELRVTVTGDATGGEIGVRNTGNPGYYDGGKGGTFSITETGSLSGDSGIAFDDRADGNYGNPSSILILEGALNGDALMGAGSDKIRITGSDATLGSSGAALTSAVLLDGDNGADSFTVGEIDVLTFDGWTGAIDGAQMMNWEEVLVTGDGDVTFSDTLAIGTGLSNENDTDGLLMQVEDGSFARFATSFQISGDLNNFGTIDLSTPNWTPDTVLTVTGIYTAASDLILDVVLGDDASDSDLLVVGGSTSGTTNVFVNNVGGTGAQTVTGILVVEVGDPDASTGDFVLANGDYTIASTGETAIIAGAYGYALRDVEGNWFLQSELLDQTPIWQPATPIYEAYPSTLLGLAGLPRLQERVGNRHWAGAPATPAEPIYVFCKDPAQNFRCAVTSEQAQVYAGASRGTVIEGQGAWVRVDGAQTQYMPVASTMGASYDATMTGIQLGYDHVLHENEDGDRLIGGLNLSYRASGADVTAAAGNGTIDTTGYGLGASLTWYEQNGLYVDGQAQIMSMSSDLSADGIGTFADGHDVRGYAFSLEVGKEIALNEAWSITPQAQLSYASVKEDGYADSYRTVVSFDAQSVQLRLGVEASHEESWEAEGGTTSRRNLRAGVHVIKEFQPETTVNVSGTTLRSEGDDLMGEITLGGSYNWSDDKHSVYGQVAAGTGLDNFGDSTRVRGTVGFRTRWE